MVTQQRNEANASMPNTTLPFQPNTLRAPPAVPEASAWAGSSGGGRRKIAASGTMTTSCRIAKPIMVQRQPTIAIERSKMVGQMKPAR